MKHLTAYIEKFNEAFSPDYRLIIWGPYVTYDSKINFGLDLQLLVTGGYLTCLIVNDVSPDLTEENIDATELRIIDAFKKVDFYQHLKRWKEN